VQCALGAVRVAAVLLAVLRELLQAALHLRVRVKDVQLRKLRTVRRAGAQRAEAVVHAAVDGQQARAAASLCAGAGRAGRWQCSRSC
jgi:hypothetical protein